MAKKHYYIRDGYIYVCASKKMLERAGQIELKSNISYYRRSTNLEATDKNIAYIEDHAIDVLLHLIVNKQVKKTIFGDYARSILIETTSHLSSKKEILSYLERFIIPFFEFSDIKDISHSDLRYWQSTLLDKGHSRDKVRRVTNTFKRILQEAVYDDIITYNPFEKLRQIKPPAPKRKEPYSIEEIETILEASRGWFKVYFIVSLMTGLRTGEVRALSWDSIDFKNGKFKIFQNKTKKYKTIPMLDLAKAALLEWKLLCPSEIYVFPNRQNKPFTSSKNINKYHFKPILEQLNIKYKSLQVTRHMFASILISKGMDITWVSRMMGHADTDTTLKFYKLYIGDLEQQSKTAVANNIIKSVFTKTPKIKEK